MRLSTALEEGQCPPKFHLSHTMMPFVDEYQRTHLGTGEGPENDVIVMEHLNSTTYALKAKMSEVTNSTPTTRLDELVHCIGQTCERKDVGG